MTTVRIPVRQDFLDSGVGDVSQVNVLLDFAFEADQLIVYQGSRRNPQFICALDNSGGFSTSQCPGSRGGWHRPSCNQRSAMRYYSELPTGLTEDVDALSWPHARNWAYVGSMTGTANELRMAIANISNWESHSVSTECASNGNSIAYPTSGRCGNQVCEAHKNRPLVPPEPALCD